MKLWLFLVFFLVLSGCVEVRECSSDSDCVVFGEDGDCNCGCYTIENMPDSPGGECFCVAPRACRCVSGKCEGVFES